MFHPFPVFLHHAGDSAILVINMFWNQTHSGVWRVLSPKWTIVRTNRELEASCFRKQTLSNIKDRIRYIGHALLSKHHNIPPRRCEFLHVVHSCQSDNHFLAGSADKILTAGR